jgi:hypothetical protein
MNIVIVKEELLYKEITKQYTINMNGKEIKVDKWVKIDNFNENFEDYDNDWELNGKESIENFNQLTDEEKDLLDDFIGEIEL